MIYVLPCQDKELTSTRLVAGRHLEFGREELRLQSDHRSIYFPIGNTDMYPEPRILLETKVISVIALL